MKALRVSYTAATLLVGVAVCAGQTVNVTTWHNDNWRTGQNNAETVLTTTLVGSTKTFGKICSYQVDGEVYAQPLIVTNVLFSGQAQAKTVAYVVTMNASVYAFDATATNCTLLKKVSLLNPGEIAAYCKDVGFGCGTIHNNLGILGTPAIAIDPNSNPTTGTLYAVAESECTKNNAQCNNNTNTFVFAHRLHAISLTDLSERSNSPVQICAQGCAGVPASQFSEVHIQRPALLWLPAAQTGTLGNSMVYAAFSMIDGATGYPNGFVFGFNAQNLGDTTRQFTYETTSGTNKIGGGVWQAAAGLAAGWDANGSYYIFFSTADGDFDLNNGGADAGDSFVKLTPSLIPASTSYANYSFTPSDQCWREAFDHDFGSGGTVLIPDNTLANHGYIAVKPDKLNYLWVMDRTSPGGFNTGGCQTLTNCQPGQTPMACSESQWANQNLEAFTFTQDQNNTNETRSTAGFWSGNNSLYVGGTYDLCSDTPFPITVQCHIRVRTARLYATRW